MSFYIAVTGKEWMRKRVLYALIALTALFVGLFALGARALAGHEASDSLDQLISRAILPCLGLFFAQFLVAFVTLFTTMGTLSGEQESGLLLAVLARPRPRWHIYAAKWIGHAVWLLLYASLLFAAIVLIVEIWGSWPLELLALLKSWAMFAAIPLVLLTIAMFGSVYLPTLGNGIFAALLYGFALFCGFAAGLFPPGTYSAVDKSFLLISLIMPTEPLFKRSMYEFVGSDTLALLPSGELGPFSLNLVPSNAFLLYVACYAAALLLLGFRAFGRKDI
jgi:ABC-type transport system involved in multi-copper enzyme maturation permease subunit